MFVVILMAVVIKDIIAQGYNDEPVRARIIGICRNGIASTVLYELDNGDRVSLSTPDRIADTFMVSDTGMLTYHETVFKSFSRIR